VAEGDVNKSTAPNPYNPSSLPDNPVDTVATTTPLSTPSKAGTHPIALHWLDWNRPGQATVTPLEDDWFSITGSQKRDSVGYLKIDGKIRRLSEKELEFDGRIETQTATTNGGQPCVKEGKQIFYAKGNRTYFRLQNMINCEGGGLVDYVDIFPGTSGL
ncbi:MAG: hypothetical protein V4676_05625, partial [Bacteroidota bacterium]